MSDDDNIDLSNEINDEPADFSENPPKKKKFISERVARMLMFVAIGLAALLLSITVSFITFRFMDRGSRARQFPVLSADYTTEIPVYTYWNFLADNGYDLRTQTNDVERYTVSAKIKLGYDDTQYKELASELTSKNDVIMDTIRFFFSQRSREQLSDETAIKAELLMRVNSLLSRGIVEQVVFLQYQTIGL